MIDRDSVLNAAANHKHKLVKRSDTIDRLVSAIAKAKSGIRRINVERLQTMEEELDFAAFKQHRDSLIYATLRWVLGVTAEIDPENLELDK